MPLNFKRNNSNLLISSYAASGDLDHISLSKTNRVQIRTSNVINYIGLCPVGGVLDTGFKSKINSVNFAVASQSLTPPFGLIYSASNVFTPTISTPISYRPTISGKVERYTIDKPLPSGLSFNQLTGEITGTTPSLSNDNTYTISAINSSGTSTCTVRLRIVYLSTTMTVGHVTSYVSAVYPDMTLSDTVYQMGFGYFKSYYGRQAMGSLANNVFRGSRIIKLSLTYDDSTNTISVLWLEVLGNYASSDSSFFRRIEWNGVFYTRTGSENRAQDYRTNEYGEWITSWAMQPSVSPFSISNKINTNNPVTTPVIIE